MEVDVWTGDKGGGGVNGGRSYGFEHFGLGALANVLGFVFLLFLFEFLFFLFFLLIALWDLGKGLYSVKCER